MYGCLMVLSILFAQSQLHRAIIAVQGDYIVGACAVAILSALQQAH
jgi:hypothetical protein